MNYNENETGFGDPIFEFDDSKSIFDRTVKLKKVLKSPSTYYFFAVLLALLVWIIYSIAVSPKGEGVANHISTIVVFVFLTAFTVVMIFGLWGKLMNLFARNSQSGAMSNVNIFRSALTVYKDNIEVVNLEVSFMYEKSQVTNIVVMRDRNKFKVVLFFDSGRPMPAKVAIPIEFLGYFVRSCAGIPIKYKRLLGYDTSFRLRESKGMLIGGTLFLLLPIVVGALLIWMHYSVNDKVPQFLGIFFIMAGLVAICALYSFIPFFKHVMVPMLFGLFFTIVPVLLAAEIFLAKGIQLDASTFFASLDPMLLGFTYITALGLFVTLNAIRSSIEYFVYGTKKKSE
ncbi:MAG: hypothetical protein K2G37_02085 [Clostridia bacterium]|nr:hypothetical protein [Clostridia bacterium]MDE7328427.1 hypothetical protein [Clostridia bacterium]